MIGSEVTKTQKIVAVVTLMHRR